MPERIVIIIMVVLTIIVYLPRRVSIPRPPAVGEIPEIGRFKPVKRDPFLSKSTRPGTLRPVEPKIEVKGIVMGRGKGMVVIQSGDGEPILLKKGERFRGVKIEQITSHYVVIQVGGRRDTLEIW